VWLPGSVLDEMLAAGIQPSLRSYKLAISSWARSGNAHEAAAVLTRLRQSGLQPDRCAFNLVPPDPLCPPVGSGSRGAAGRR